MQRRSDILLLVLLLGLGAAYQILFLREGVGLIDEGHLANAARRLSSGDVLYRDVYTVYPPASFYVVSLLFELLGTSLIVVRGFHVLMTLALAAIVFVSSRTLMPAAWAWLAGMLVAATGWEAILERCHYSYLYSVFPIAALMLFSKHVAGDDRRRWLFWVGALAGLTLTFRLVPFVALAFAIAVVVAIQEGWTRRGFESLGWLVGGTAVVVAPVGLFFVSRSAGMDLFESVFWTSFGQYVHGGQFNLPFPALELWPAAWTRVGLRRLFINWEFYLPVLIYLGAIAEFVLRRKRRREVEVDRASTAASLQRLALALFGGVLFLRATGRSDYYHLAPVLAPAYMLGVDALARLWQVGWIRGGRQEQRGAFAAREPIASALVVVVVLIASLWLHDVDGAARRILEGRSDVALSPGGPRVRSAGALDDLVLDLRARIAPGEEIIVLPWYPVLYFLAEGSNPTRYDWLFPGYLDSEGAVESLIDEIDRSGAEVVVYSPTSIDGRGDRSLAAFAPEIDRYLRQRFRPVKRYGNFVVMTRGRR